MSVIFIRGFEGVSVQSRRVSGRIAERTAARSVMSTSDQWIPQRGRNLGTIARNP
jgi:hypothetical protein